MRRQSRKMRRRREGSERVTSLLLLVFLVLQRRTRVLGNFELSGSCEGLFRSVV
jgi:hypothetical protein